jgi:hypothetical protein
MLRRSTAQIHPPTTPVMNAGRVTSMSMMGGWLSLLPVLARAVAAITEDNTDVLRIEHGHHLHLQLDVRRLDAQHAQHQKYLAPVMYLVVEDVPKDPAQRKTLHPLFPRLVQPADVALLE